MPTEEYIESGKWQVELFCVACLWGGGRERKEGIGDFWQLGHPLLLLSLHCEKGPRGLNAHMTRLCSHDPAACLSPRMESVLSEQSIARAELIDTESSVTAGERIQHHRP